MYKRLVEQCYQEQKSHLHLLYNQKHDYTLVSSVDKTTQVVYNISILY